MSDPQVIEIVSMAPTDLGEPTPEVLMCFQVRVLKAQQEGCVKLSLDFCTQSLMVSPPIPKDQANICIESLMLGLRFGHTAAGYVSEGDMWVSKKSLNTNNE